MAKGKVRANLTARKRSASSLEPDDDASDSHESGKKRVRWDGEVPEDVQTQQNEEEEESECVPNKVFLAATCQSGRIGAAYYDPITSKVYVLEDSQENAQYDLTRTVIEQAAPDVVLVSSKADDGCIDVLRNHMDASAGVFQIRPHKDFIAAKGRERILSLQLLSVLPMDDHNSSHVSGASLDSESRNAYDFMQRRKDVTGDPHTQRWNASIRLANYASIDGSPLCLGSVGALLDHLSRERAVGDLHDEGIGGLEVRSIEYLTLKEVMQINADALYSLQIFDSENHASIHSDKTKEGLSLFGILDNTKTSLGRALLREWILRPSMSVPVIAARHDAVTCFVHPENHSSVAAMHVHLKGIKNVPRTLTALRTGKAKLWDWQAIVKFAFHTVMLRDALSELTHAGHVPVVRKLLGVLDVVSFKETGNAVNETINWEESANAARVCVRPHVDEDLDELKHIYHGIDAVLSKVAEHVSSMVPPGYATTLNVVYFPQLGFLICVPMRDEWKDGQIDVLDGWSFQFSSEAQVYFKSQEMHDLDKHLGDIHSSIVDREIEIIQELLDRILVHNDAIVTVCDVCAELDCLLSFADAAKSYDLCRPKITEHNVTIIKGGRHPLQQLVVDTFVPNDTCIKGADCADDVMQDLCLAAEDELDESVRDSKNSIVVCTGANACGKSVYLKQVALIQFMAQIGSFVPAQSATLGIVDKIFTRIQTRESVSRVQSAFMIDLNQVSLALRNATSRSLVLLDEFGKGTVSSDGAGLFCGVLTHLVNGGTSCPKILAATHFHEVFREDMLDPDTLPISFLHMQAMITSDRGEVLGVSSTDSLSFDSVSEDGESRERPIVMPGERITYLYRIGKGLGLHSHAAMCAEIFGVPRPVVRRAQYVSHLLTMHEIGKLLDEDMTEEERAELEIAEDVCRRFLACDLVAEKDAVSRGSAKKLLAQVLGGEEDEEDRFTG